MNPLPLLPLADIGELAGVAAAVLFFALPIVAVLTNHQRRMAEILHGKNREENVDSRVLAEIGSLRQLIAEQTLQIDSLSRRQEELSRRLAGDEIRDRLNA